MNNLVKLYFKYNERPMIEHIISVVTNTLNSIF